MKPKQKTLLSVLIMILMFIPGISVFAENETEEEIFTSGDYSYTVRNGGATLVNYTNFTETVVTIPHEIDGYPVKALGENLFFTVSETDPTISKVAAEKFIIPASVEEVGAFVFYGCVNVKEFEVAEDSTVLCDVDGVIFDKDKTIVIAYPIASVATEYTVPSGVTYIDYGAFANCNTLEKVIFPNTLVSIGQWAFARCSNLKELSLPEYIDTIEKYAFAYCTGLTDIKWSESLIKLERGAFGACTSLTELTFPESLSEIGQGAFSECTSLTKVTLPEDLDILNEGAFSGCTSLNEIELPSKLVTLGEKAVGFNYNMSKELVKNVNFKIYGKTGSLAEAYAIENEFTFISTGAVENQESNDSDESKAETKTSFLNSEGDGKGVPKTLVLVLSVAGLAVVAGIIAVAVSKKKKS